MDEREEAKGREPFGAAGGEGGPDTAGAEPTADTTPTSSRGRRGTRGGQRRRGARGAAASAAQSAPEAPASAPLTEPESADSAGASAGADHPARRSRRRRKAAPEAAAPGAAPTDAAAPASAPTDATPPDDLAESESAPRPARRSRRRRKAEPETASAARMAPDVRAEPTAPDAAASEDVVKAEDGEDSAPKRRRRGARGGRRVRAREARRAAAHMAPEDETAAGPTAPAGIVKVPEAGPEVPPAGASGDALAETGATTGETAVESEATPGARRRGHRGGRRKVGAEPETAQAATSSSGVTAEAERVGPQGALPAEPVESDGREPGAGKKRTRRGGRRGKRLTPEGSAESGIAGAGAAPADGAVPDAGLSHAETPAIAETPATAPAPAKEERPSRKGRRDRRRPKAIVRPEALTGADADAVAGPALTTGRRPEVKVELPKRKLILVTEDPSELRVALVEDGRLAEIYFERPEKRSYLGDIYRGKVENVLAGIDAAFVDFGLDKNGFLYVDEVRTGEGDRRGRRIGDVLKPGQDVLVQVMKDPMGSKGARLTMHISLAGRYVVYVPGGSGVGVSRRLSQDERDRLRDLCKELRVKNAGLIVRTAAEGEGLEEVRRDVRVLSRLWSRLKKKAETAPIPGLIHKEVDISLEVTRDLFNESVESLIVDDEKRHKAIVGFLEKVAPELVSRVRLHTGAEPLFEAYGIEQQISRALERRVPLPSGGNIVIDHAEALTVIDVNSGRYTSGKGLEDTILRTNLEAAREVVRQLRLRDIGGIIIIDFIDMSHVKNRETVLATLEGELDTDRTKTYVVELSPLGLVEMTRQNTTDGARGILTRTCQSCQGKARTLSEETVALTVERRLRVHARKSGARAYLVEVNVSVAERLTVSGRLKALEKETGRRIFLEGSTAVAVDGFRILAEGSVEQVQGQRIPVREGQEVDVELEFALTYSPRDAVGYVDGYMVIVEGGRAFLGERRKVRVTGTSRTGASAVLTGGRGGSERG